METTFGSNVSSPDKVLEGSTNHEQALSEIMVINDNPASNRPATPATSVTSKRTPSPSPGSAIRKRSKPDTPPVVATQAAGSASKVSLRDCEREQMIGNKIVPRMEILHWGVFCDGWLRSASALVTLLAPKFDEDYLSTDLHVSEWGKLLRLREKGVATQCCVNDTVIMRAKQRGDRTGQMNEACDRCIRAKRLCARLVRDREVISLAFVPLPQKYRRGAMIDSLDYWVRS